MRKSKSIVLILSAIVIAAASIFGTLAYLTDSSKVVNTFTMGNVDIKLDEAVVDETGTPTSGRTETGNAYHLVPGMTYIKDPTVTVVKGSEESYIRVMVTVNCKAALDAIFAPTGANLLSIFNGYDDTKWSLVDETIENDTRTYEFRYYQTVKPASDSDSVLEPIFGSFTVPADITGGQLDTIADLTISVEAYAIQAAGFADADKAWEAFAG